MIKKLTTGLLVLLYIFLPNALTASNHNTQTSHTFIHFKEGTNRIEISIKLNAKDLERYFIQEKGIKLNLGSPRKLKQADDHICTYLSTHLSIHQQQKALEILCYGSEFDQGELWFYMETSRVNDISPLRVINTILVETFAEQINFVSIQNGDFNKKLAFSKDALELTVPIQ